jgi:hypothetical protein
VFFRSVSQGLPLDFPQFAGLARPTISIVYEDDMDGTSATSVAKLLDLESNMVLHPDVPTCSTCAGTARKGKGLELTGADMFQSVTHPLAKGAHHFVDNVKPPQTAVYFDLYAILRVAVLDAPMFLASIHDGEHRVVASPWLRLIRHEYDRSQGHRFERDTLAVVDVVHSSFVNQFLHDYLEPLGDAISRSTKMCEKVLAKCKGVAKGSWRDRTPLAGRVRGDHFGARAMAMLKMNN